MIATENKHPTREKTAYILDDHLLFAESFASLLKSVWLFADVTKSSNEEEMLEHVKAGNTSHLFLNFNIAGFRTADIIHTVRQLNRSVNIIIICDTANIFYLRRIVSMDGNAFISTKANVNEIDICINTLKLGRSYICKSIRELLANDSSITHPLHFTNKEMQVLQLMAKGFTINETAAALCLSKHTIVSHRRKIMNKSGLNTATGLVKFAIEAGLID